MARAKTKGKGLHEDTAYDRVCISMPLELSVRLRNNYPYMEFSSIVCMLLICADAAGFPKRLQDISPELYAEFSVTKKGRPKEKHPFDAEINEALQVVAPLEIFGT
jgi:hypothetical protein